MTAIRSTGARRKAPENAAFSTVARELSQVTASGEAGWLSN
jgi:hypothetical protein